MLESIFVKLLEISIRASFFILAVMLIRIFFKRLPKQFICILWGLVAARLVLPFEITSVFSLVPDTSQVQTLVEMVYVPQEGISLMEEFPEQSNQDTSATNRNDVTTSTGTATNSNDVTTSTGTATTGSIASMALHISRLLSYFWIVGMVLLLGYAAISYTRTRLRLREAVHDSENIWYSDTIPAPFVIGYWKPRIYIPFSINKTELPYILAHEKSHISHWDHVGKLLGYVILSVYWFHPLIWAAYLLYCVDLELACDERVIHSLGEAEKKPYSQALLVCSVSNKTLLQSPLAFGEVAIKERIMNILNYKKPEFWGILASTVICLIVAVCFMTSSESNDPSGNNTLAGAANASETQENFNGFLLSKKEENGQHSYEYRYYDESEDVTIRMNGSGTRAAVIHDGKELSIDTYGIFHDSGELGGSTLPYLADVTGDGQKELIIQFATPTPTESFSFAYDCYVYRLDTMEEVFFNTDATELAKLLTFTPLSFKAESNELTVQVEFDEKIHPNLIESDRTPWEITAEISPEKTDYWKEAHYAHVLSEYASLYYNETTQSFHAYFTIYLDDTCAYSRFYPFAVNYLWDEAAGEFIMDLETAGVQIAG